VEINMTGEVNAVDTSSNAVKLIRFALTNVSMKILNATDVPNLILRSVPQFSCPFETSTFILLVFIDPCAQKRPFSLPRE